ncbi:hypothetical protein BD779DRAFT_1469669 [Infundibulicybe gibba]|nr:hypothetical protein BD779DRAFT_1469669 [Infundibulicybe gibba]
MADLFASDGELQNTPKRPTRTKRTSAARALRKQQEEADLDALLAATAGKFPWFLDIPTCSHNQTSLTAWNQLIPGKASKKRPPPTPNKASEKSKVPKTVHTKASSAAKSAGTSSKSSKVAPPTRDKANTASIPLKGPSKARAEKNPPRAVKSSANARQHLPPNMEADESETEDEPDRGGLAVDAAMEVDSDDETELSQKSGDGDEASQRSGGGSELDSDLAEDMDMERANWGLGVESSDEGDEANTTLRQPPYPEIPALSRASSIASFTDKIMSLDIHDSLPGGVETDDVGSQSTKRPSAAKSRTSRPVSPSSNSPSVARGATRLSASRRTSHNKSRRPPSPVDQGPANSRARSVSSTSGSSVQQAQSTQTTVVRTTVKSSSMKVVGSDKKTAKSVPAKVAAERATGVSKRKEKSQKEVRAQYIRTAYPNVREAAGWSDSSTEGESMDRSTTKSAVKTLAVSASKSKSVVRAEYNEELNDPQADMEATPTSDAATSWPESTTFVKGGLNAQSKPIKILLRCNIADIRGDLAFETAYPNRVVLTESATKSLLAHAKQLKLTDIRQRLKQDHEYLSRFLKLSTPRVSNERTKLKEICITQCLTHYQIKPGSHERAATLVKDNQFIFPEDPSTDTFDNNKPFQHPAILSTLELAYFHGSKSYLKKFPHRFPTTTVQGEAQAMIPKVMIVSIATMIYHCILHAADGNQSFDPEQMQVTYRRLMKVISWFEANGPGEYKAAMIQIFKTVSHHDDPTSEASDSELAGTYKLFNFLKMDKVIG